MYKNYRVGSIKYVSNKRLGKQYIILNAMESCVDKSGEPYTATYNLWVAVDSETVITRADVGRFCEVGFYIQSFRIKDVDAAYDTILTMKSFRFFDSEEEAKEAANQISKSISNTNN